MFLGRLFSRFFRRDRPTPQCDDGPIVPSDPEQLVRATQAVRFDPHRPYEIVEQGVMVQRAVIDVLLADGRMTRTGVLAYYEPESPSDPVRLSYVPIHELVESEEVPA